MWMRFFRRLWRTQFVWTAEMQLEHVRNLVMTDHRWLAHDKTAEALTSRYLAALNEEWFRIPSEDITQLRPRLGLCPHEARREAKDQLIERQRWIQVHAQTVGDLRAAQDFIMRSGIEGADEVLALTGGSVRDVFGAGEG